MRCKLNRITYANPFKGSNYKKSIHANYACELTYADVRCSASLKELLIAMTQKTARQRITAVDAKAHKFLMREEERPFAGSDFLKKYKNQLVSSQVNKSITRIVIDNFSAEYGGTYKENHNYVNRVSKPIVENKSTIRYENYSTTYQSKAPVFKTNTLNNASGVNSLKSQMMKYRRVKMDSGRLVGRNGTEATRENTGFTNALLKFKTTKVTPSTFR